uniref:Uncharacterized protein n=1 Tax=Setaria viridis TaxID=4556 RepID=A0A4U6WF05_SETVI|nr:hypothetical protein SEVIR_1G314900v2 [Setaria viridis]
MSPHTRRQVFRSEQANPSRDINVKRSSVKPIPAFPRVQPSQGKTRIRSIAPSPLSGLRGRMWPVSYRGLGRTRHAAPPAGVATAPVTPTCRGAVVGSECYLGARAVLRQPSLSFCHWSLSRSKDQSPYDGRYNPQNAYVQRTPVPHAKSISSRRIVHCCARTRKRRRFSSCRSPANSLGHIRPRPRHLTGIAGFRPQPARHQIKPMGAERLLPARALMRLGATTPPPPQKRKSTGSSDGVGRPTLRQPINAVRHHQRPSPRVAVGRWPSSGAGGSLRGCAPPVPRSRRRDSRPPATSNRMDGGPATRTPATSC